MRKRFTKSTEDLINIAEDTKKMINIGLINLRSANADIQDRIDEKSEIIRFQKEDIDRLVSSRIANDKLIREVSNLLGV